MMEMEFDFGYASSAHRQHHFNLTIAKLLDWVMKGAFRMVTKGIVVFDYYFVVAVEPFAEEVIPWTRFKVIAHEKDDMFSRRCVRYFTGRKRKLQIGRKPDVVISLPQIAAY